MARADLIQTNMTGGELSPSLALGRPDIAKYSNGLRRAENVTITVQGGVKRRPGSLFVAPVRNATNDVRLIEFIFNRDQAYVMEVGQGYTRFIRNRTPILAGGTPYEVPNPYTEAMLPSINYVQKADTAFMVHEAVYPQRLQRFGDAQWVMQPAPFTTEPVEEQGSTPAFGVTIGAASGPTTATATGAAFYPSDVGRRITYLAGGATITGFTSTSSVFVEVEQPFPTLTLPAGGWRLTDSPFANIVPSNTGKVGDFVSLAHASASLGAEHNIGNAAVQEVGYLEVFQVGHLYSTGDTILVTESALAGNAVAGVDGRHLIEVLSVDSFRFPYSGPPINLDAGKTAKLIDGAPTAVWRGEDVGKSVMINGGTVQITAVPTPTIANGKILRVFTAATPASAGSWSLQGAAWTAANGYPRAVTINKQRLLFAGSPAYPQNLWGSAIRGYLDFAFGVEADEPFRFELDGSRNSPIRHLAPARQMLAMTDSDEMSISGGQDNSITPTNIQKTDQSAVGSGPVRPIKVGNELVFVPPTGRRLYAVGYRYEIDGFSASDRTVFASHITGPGIRETSFRKEVDQQLFAVRKDGVIAVCAYDIDQEVTGWARWTTRGAFESIVTVPTATSEDTYVTVRRLVGGVAKRFIEVFDPEMLVDCGIRATSVVPGGQPVWAGLSHLEGREVVVYADGASLGTFTVSGGQVALPRNAVEVQIGLQFQVLVEPLQIEAGGQGSTSQAGTIDVREVILRVLDTTGALVNGQPVEFRKFDMPNLDLPPPVVSGEIRTVLLQDDIYTTTLVIEQREPMPFHLLNIIRRVTANA